MSDLRKEIEKRRTFAIISHPDAGKTTLTEKFLLYGGAIRLAGSVKARKAQSMQFLTGWKLKNKEVFLLHHQLCNLIMMDYCINISRYSRAPRFSVKIHIEHLWQQTLQ